MNTPKVLKVIAVTLPTGQVVVVRDYGNGQFRAGGGGFEGTAELRASASETAQAVDFLSKKYRDGIEKKRQEAEALALSKQNRENAKKLRKPFTHKGKKVDTVPQFDALVAEYIEMSEDDAYLQKCGVHESGASQKVLALMERDGIDVSISRINESRKRLKTP